MIGGAILQTCAQLSPDFYDKSCPDALKTIRRVVEEATQREVRMGASLLRLHFHDCFVNGCDGSNLLDDTATLKGEKTATLNLNSLRGFDVVDDIKAALNDACHGNVVSCADILAVAARDSVNILGGKWYQVLLGRRDSLTASFDDANKFLPTPNSSLDVLESSFQKQGLDLQDLVVLSGAHTIGLARCAVYQPRLYNDTNIDEKFKADLQKSCPNPSRQNNNTYPLDLTWMKFDAVYYQDLLQQKGLLHSDQELYRNDGGQADKLVVSYSNNADSFLEDFGKSMIKMGNIKPLMGMDGEIRLNCRRVN